MIEINLLPVEYRPKAAAKFVMPQLPVKKTFILVAVIVFGAQLLVSLFAVYEVWDLAMVNSRVDQLSVDTGRIAQKKADSAAIGDRLRKLRVVTDKKYRWSELLNSLTRSTTKGIWLTGFSVVDIPTGDPKSARVSRVLKLDGSVVGQGEEAAFTGKYIKELKSDPVFADLFSGIELSNLVQKKIRDFDVYDFSIYCTFKPEKAITK